MSQTINLNKYCYLCDQKSVVSSQYGDFCLNHVTNMMNYIRSDLSYKVEIKNEVINNCLVCSKTKLCFKHANKICSGFFMCEQCLREDNILTKGSKRYDSLVLCEKHNIEFRPIIEQVYKIFE